MTNKTWRRWTLHVITTLGGERLERIIGPRMHDEIAEVIEIGALNEAEERVRYYRNEWESACERVGYAKGLEAENEWLAILYGANHKDAVVVDISERTKLQAKLALRDRQLERAKELISWVSDGLEHFKDRKQVDHLQNHIVQALADKIKILLLQAEDCVDWDMARPILQLVPEMVECLSLSRMYSDNGKLETRLDVLLEKLELIAESEDE